MANKNFIESFNKAKEKHNSFFGWELIEPNCNNTNDWVYNDINFNEKLSMLSWGNDAQIFIDNDIDDIDIALQELYETCLSLGYKETLDN